MRSGRPVQDRALGRRVLTADCGDVCVLALADGHGGEEHFRSDIGAEIATELVAGLLPGFMAELDCVVGGEVSAGVGDASCSAVNALVRPFLGRIMSEWCSRVLAHWRENPADTGLQSPARAYGCTLLGAACCNRLWFSFQLGDGAVIALDDSGTLIEPEPDPRCIGNVTTSMCNCSQADFRYRVGREVPAVIMLCSDGLEKCYDGHETIVDDFISPVLDNIVAEGIGDTVESLEELLPSMSEQYTRDDMSVAFCLDFDRAASLAENLAPKITDRYKADLRTATSEFEDISRKRGALMAELEEMDDPAEAERKKAVLRTLDRQLAGLAEEIEFYKNKLNV